MRTIQVSCNEHMPSSFELSDSDSLRLSANSLERVINLAIDRLSKSSHPDSMTAHDDLVELKSIAVHCWVSTQQAVFAYNADM